MIEQGRRLAKIHDNIVIKTPLTEAGLRACRTLTSEGTRVNVTLCFSPTQAHLAAKAGATYISPFIGRIDDVAGDGMELISQIRQIYDNYDIETEILAASIRHPQHMVQALLIGADCGTLPPKVLYQLLEHPLTDKGPRRLPGGLEIPREGSLAANGESMADPMMSPPQIQADVALGREHGGPPGGLRRWRGYSRLGARLRDNRARDTSRAGGDRAAPAPIG